MRIKSGFILLVDTEGIVPSTIDFVQGNDYNHAGLIVEAYNKLFVFEALEHGPAFTDFDEYIEKFTRRDVNLLILEPKFKFAVPESVLMRFLLPLTSAGYEYTNLLIFQPVRYLSKWIGKLFGRSWDLWIGRRKSKSDKSFICGELVGYIYNNFYPRLFIDWNEIAPVDIFNCNSFNHIKYKNIKL